MEPPTSSIRAHYDIEDAIEHLYDVTIFSRTILTTVTKYPEAVTQWINDVNPDDNTLRRYVGFEAEFSTCDTSTRPTGTVQFCLGSRCLVIQLLDPSPCPPALHKFIADRNTYFFGIDIHPKMQLLGNHFSFRFDPTAMELGVSAAARYKWRELRQAEQKVLALTALGMEVEMPLLDTDWGGRSNFSDVQVQYACIEAFLNLEIGRWLINFPD